MEIRIKQIGGYAGEVDLGSVDTARLGERGKQLERLVAALPTLPAAALVGADLPRYRITLVEGGRQRTVEAADQGGENDPVRALVAAAGG